MPASFLPGSSGEPPRSLVAVPTSATPAPSAARPAMDPPALRQTATIGRLLRALGRCWRPALALGTLLGVTAAAAVWMLRPDKFTADALIRVASSEHRVLRDLGPDHERGSSYIKTQIALLRSRPVLRSAVRSEQVRDLPIASEKPDLVGWLEKDLRIEQVDGTEVVRVSLTSRGDGSDLAPLVNAVVQSYMDEVVKGEHANQLARLDELRKLYAHAEERLRSLRELVTTLSRDLKGGDSKILTLRQQSLLDEAASLRREAVITGSRIRDLDLKIQVYRLRLRSAEANEGADLVDALVEREVDSDQQVLAQDVEVTRQRRFLQEFDVAAANPKSPLRLDLERNLEAAEQRLQTVRTERRKVIAARHRQVNQANAGQLVKEAEAERSLLEDQKDQLEEEIGTLKRELEHLGINSVELELKRAEIGRSEEFLKAVWDQRERMEAELKVSARPRVSVVALADEAMVLNKMGRIQEASAAGFAGLSLGLFVMAYREFRRGRIYSSTDVTRGLQLRVLGALPQIPAGQIRGTLTGTAVGRQGQAMIESVDGLRTILLHEKRTQQGTVLMVASAVAGEGKSTLAAELASSLARAHRNTLLIDGDLRSPSLHRLLNVSRSPGLCDLLSEAGAKSGPDTFSDTARVESKIQSTAIDRLHLLSAGAVSPDAIAGLSQAASLTRLIDSLRDRYEFILLDSSPLLTVPDALMVAGAVDGLILSVRPGVSQVAEVYDGYERLSEYQLPFVGVVMNGVAPQKQYYHRYGELPAQIAADRTISDR
jgi:polysaccharide biosynthesis transport protein